MKSRFMIINLFVLGILGVAVFYGLSKKSDRDISSISAKYNSTPTTRAFYVYQGYNSIKSCSGLEKALAYLKKASNKNSWYSRGMAYGGKDGALCMDFNASPNQRPVYSDSYCRAYDVSIGFNGLEKDYRGEMTIGSLSELLPSLQKLLEYLNDSLAERRQTCNLENKIQETILWLRRNH